MAELEVKGVNLPDGWDSLVLVLQEAHRAFARDPNGGPAALGAMVVIENFLDANGVELDN